jgi:hypothetical protein
MSNDSGNITISNGCNENIMATVVRYDNEQYSDIKPFPINTGSSKSWERHPSRYYFCFLSEAKILYGFLCKGGKSYNYNGQGQMVCITDQKNYKLETDMKSERGKISILAVLEDVEFSIFRDLADEKPLFTRNLKKNAIFSEQVEDNCYYYLKIKGDRTDYGVIPGVSYYIAKAQVLVEVDTNIIKKQHKTEHIKAELR